MNKLNNTNKLNKITFSISIIIFLLFSCGILCQTYIEKTCLLYDNSLRFHVRADSDEKEAQERKLIVRDAILQYVKTDVEQAHSAGELKQTLAKKTKQIARIAAKAADGKPVRVYFTQERFPIRHYGAAIFPAGEYQALRIDIGKAQGHNWWCVLYPNLCFLDTTNAVLPEKGKQQLKKVLTEEEYSEVTAGSKFQIRWFFWKEK